MVLKEYSPGPWVTHHLRVQVEGVWGYNEDQVALVIPHSTIFGSQVTVTLDTLAIKWIINMLKESKTNELSASLNGLKMVWLLAGWWAELSFNETRVFSTKAGAGRSFHNQTVDPTDVMGGSQNTKEGGDRYFFVQNNAWPNENHASGKQHECNDSGPERRW